MRFLFGVRPFLGHLYPMVPLGRELIFRGHDVIVGSASCLASEVAAAGLSFQSAGLHPSAAQAGPAGYVDRPAGYGDYILQTKISELMAIPDIDVVIREPTDLAAAIAAEAMDLPCVVLGFSHYLSRDLWRQILRGDLDTVRTLLGLEPDPSLQQLVRNLYLDTVPAWFQARQPDTTNYARCDGGSYQAPPDSTPPQCPPPPYAYLTLGTHYHGDHEFFRIGIIAAQQRGLPVVVSAGSEQTLAELATLASPSVVLTRYVPQAQILNGANIVICHGGYGTVVGAIRAGVPVVCVPRGSDHANNARRCEDLGVGHTVARSDWTTTRAAQAISTMVDNPGPSRRAQKLAERDDNVASIGHAATLLEELPNLAARGCSVADRLEAIQSMDPISNYGKVNRNGWQALSRRAKPPAFSIESAHRARRRLDPNGWLPWERIENVLCIASGGGEQGPLFASLGCRVVVVDLSGEQLRRDREIAAVNNLALETLEADMCELSALGEREFDLVYQPISTLYVPDVGKLYSQVSAHVRPGAWYWSQHYSPLHLQLDHDRPWDGEAYRIRFPQQPRSAIPWTTQIETSTVTIHHFVHGMDELIGSLCAAGFDLLRFAESGHTADNPRPGSTEHLNTFFPAFITLLARRQTSGVKP
jgi:UDP:flavonoid glycosyltransferase YjiC (YdhE family)